MTKTFHINDEDVPIVLDRLRMAGALEIDNASTPEEEAKGIHLRDLADRLERQLEPTYEVQQDLEEMTITDSDGNELTAASGEGGVEFVTVFVAGRVEYTIEYSTDPNLNAWTVASASIWLDRRAAEDIELGLPVAKLQDQPEVHRLLTRFREELS